MLERLQVCLHRTKGEVILNWEVRVLRPHLGQKNFLSSYGFRMAARKDEHFYKEKTKLKILK